MVRPPGIKPMFASPDVAEADDLYRHLGRTFAVAQLARAPKSAATAGGKVFGLLDNEGLSTELVSAVHERQTKKAVAVIVDLQKVHHHRAAGLGAELEKMLNRLEANPDEQLPLAQVQRFHLLYERTAADLARIMTYSSEPETRRFLENLVARAYGEIHETREKQRRFFPLQWFFKTLAANVPPTHPGLLSVSGHHPRRLRVRRTGHRL